MEPVMRALQSIADIENETRELGQLEPASACRTARFEPTTTFATSEGTADLNTDSRALEIADVETNASEAAGASFLDGTLQRQRKQIYYVWFR